MSSPASYLRPQTTSPTSYLPAVKLRGRSKRNTSYKSTPIRSRSALDNYEIRILSRASPSWSSTPNAVFDNNNNNDDDDNNIEEHAFEAVVPAEIAAKVFRKEMSEAEMKRYVAKRSVRALSPHQSPIQFPRFRGEYSTGTGHLQDSHKASEKPNPVQESRDERLDMDESVARMRSQMEASKRLQSLSTQMYSTLQNMEEKGNEELLELAENIDFPIMDLIGGGGDPSLYMQNIKLLVERNRGKVAEILKEHDITQSNRNNILSDLSRWLNDTYEREESDYDADMALEHSIKKLVEDSEHSVRGILDNMRKNGEKLVTLQRSLETLVQSVDHQMLENDGLSIDARRKMREMEQQMQRMTSENNNMQRKLKEVSARTRVLDTLLTREAKEKDIFKLKNEKETGSSRKQLDLLRAQWNTTEKNYQSKIKALKQELNSQARRMITGNHSAQGDQYIPNDNHMDFNDVSSTQEEIDELMKERDALFVAEEKLRFSIVEKDDQVKFLKTRMREMKMQEAMQDQRLDVGSRPFSREVPTESIFTQTEGERADVSDATFALNSGRSALTQRVGESIDYTERMRELLSDSLMQNVQQAIFDHFMKWDDRDIRDGTAISRDSEERSELLEVITDMVVKFQGRVDGLNAEHVEKLVNMQDDMSQTNDSEGQPHSEAHEDSKPHEEEITIRYNAMRKEVENLRLSEAHTRKELKNLKLRLGDVKNKNDNGLDMPYEVREYSDDALSKDKPGVTTNGADSTAEEESKEASQYSNKNPARRYRSPKKSISTPHKMIPRHQPKRSANKKSVTSDVKEERASHDTEEVRRQRFHRLFRNSSRKVRNSASIQLSSFQLDMLRLLRRSSDNHQDTILAKVDGLVERYEKKVLQLEEQKQTKRFYNPGSYHLDEAETSDQSSIGEGKGMAGSTIRNSIQGRTQSSTNSRGERRLTHLMDMTGDAKQESGVTDEDRPVLILSAVAVVEERMKLLISDYCDVHPNAQLTVDKQELQELGSQIAEMLPDPSMFLLGEKLAQLSKYIMALHRTLKPQKRKSALSLDLSRSATYKRSSNRSSTSSLHLLQSNLDREQIIQTGKSTPLRQSLDETRSPKSWSFLQGNWEIPGRNVARDGSTVATQHSSPSSSPVISSVPQSSSPFLSTGENLGTNTEDPEIPGTFTEASNWQEQWQGNGKKELYRKLKEQQENQVRPLEEEDNVSDRQHVDAFGIAHESHCNPDMGDGSSGYTKSEMNHQFSTNDDAQAMSNPVISTPSQRRNNEQSSGVPFHVIPIGGSILNTKIEDFRRDVPRWSQRARSISTSPILQEFEAPLGDDVKIVNNTRVIRTPGRFRSNSGTVLPFRLLGQENNYHSDGGEDAQQTSLFGNASIPSKYRGQVILHERLQLPLSRRDRSPKGSLKRNPEQSRKQYVEDDTTRLLAVSEILRVNSVRRRSLEPDGEPES